MRLAIHLAAVSHTVDAHDANLVRNLVNHALVAHADAPVILAPYKFAATGRAGGCRKGLDGRDDAVVNLGDKP
jgi:hypothetical protein